MQVREPPYSRHRLKAAFEFGFNAIGTTRLDLTHFRKDLERLTNAENKVERGCLLFFVRRAVRKEFAVLSYLPEDEKKALGL